MKRNSKHRGSPTDSAAFFRFPSEKIIGKFGKTVRLFFALGRPAPMLNGLVFSKLVSMVGGTTIGFSAVPICPAKLTAASVFLALSFGFGLATVRRKRAAKGQKQNSGKGEEKHGSFGNPAARSEPRYGFLFEHVPISVWVEDFSDVRTFLNDLKKRGVADFRRYFIEHPEDLKACVRKVRVLDVNPFTLNLYGYPSKAALVKGLIQTFGPETYAVFRDELVSLFEGKMEFQAEATTYKSSGEKLHIQIGVRIPEENREDWAYVLVSITDISHRVRMEQALRESESKFRGVVENSLDGIVVTDEQGRVTHWNRGAEQIFGLLEEEVVGEPLYEIQLKATPEAALTPELRQTVRKRLDDFFQFGKAPWLNRKYETKIQLQNGAYKTIESLAFSIPTKKGVILAAVIRDVTERIKAKQALQHSLEEKELLLREIHHRVKNNLQIVSSLLRLQANGVSQAGTAQILLESQNRIRTMGLIHEKLYRSTDLARIRFTEYARSLVEEISRAYQIGLRKIRFSVEGGKIALNVSQAIACGLILNELVTNSIKYAFPETFFRAKNRTPEISVRLSKLAGKAYQLRISDNGVGMPPDFDWNRPTALGLRLVKILAEDQLQGTVTMHSNSGTHFVVRFKKEKTHG